MASPMECALCRGEDRRVVVTIAITREPLVACHILSCNHAWHATLEMPGAPLVACDCRRGRHGLLRPSFATPRRRVV